MFMSIALLLSILFFLFGTSSTHSSVVNHQDGRESGLSTEYRYNWQLLGIFMPIAILWYPVSMYVGATIKSQQANLLATLSQIAVFIPAFAGLGIVALFDIPLSCFDSLFYFILTFAVSIPMIILLMAKLRRLQQTLFKAVIVVIIGLVCATFVEIYVVRPLILLAYLIFALVLSLPLFTLINAPFHRVILIPYLLFITIVIVVHSVPWTSRHHFLRNLNRIRAGRYLDREEPGMIVLARRHGRGMTFADVEQIMQGYTLMVNGNWYRPLKKLYNPKIPFIADYVSDPNARKELSIIDGRASYRHSGAWYFNADFGWVEFQGGHVVRTRFLPD